ncbi:MAG: V-type ATP synthase subunit D [Muribaculaceae bacterium]|nr:V-type ATP synthase subunit D [Muribaculaceae bacterium]
MASTQVNPTRMELARLKKKRLMAVRGHKLLKDKRDELMKRFIAMVEENKVLREKVETGLRKANQRFLLAKSEMSDEAINVALLAPKQSVSIEVSSKNIMSVNVPQFDYKTRTADSNDIYSYGLAFTSSSLDEAVKSLSAVFEDMLKLAEVEKACQLLADEIEKTRRRVNALEYVVIPQAESGIRYISMKLDGNERSAQARLMKTGATR